MNKSYLAENRELAFQVWRTSGQNVEQTLRALRKHPEGFPVSKPTIYDWIETYGWKERAARADAVSQSAADASGSDKEVLLMSLKKIQERYEKYFEKLGETSVDNQAAFAYRGIVSAILELEKRISSEGGKAKKPGEATPKGLTKEKTNEIKKKILGIV